MLHHCLLLFRYLWCKCLFLFSKSQWKFAAQNLVRAAQEKVGTKLWIFAIIVLYICRSQLFAHPEVCMRIAHTESFKHIPDCLKVCMFTSFDFNNEGHESRLVTSVCYISAFNVCLFRWLFQNNILVILKTGTRIIMKDAKNQCMLQAGVSHK